MTPMHGLGRLVVSISAALAVIFVATPPAGAAPAVVVSTAKKMKCGSRADESLAGPANRGVECRVVGRGKFYVLRYNDPARGIRYLRNWVMGEDQFIARKGRLLIVPAGPGDWYDLAQARYAARRLDGRVVRLS